MCEDSGKFDTFSIECESSILVVDDEESVLKLLTRYLGRLGYKVTTASDGEEGLSRVKEHYFDCALVDLNMPKLSGDELLKEIKRISPTTEVIIITGYATIESAVKCLGKLGAYDFITKPLHPISIVGPVVRKALERRKLYLENQGLIHELKNLNAHLERKVKEKTAALEDAYETLTLSYNELNHYISALININQLLLSITWSTDLDFIINNVLHYAMSITDSENALIMRTDEKGRVTDFTYAARNRNLIAFEKGGEVPPLMAQIIKNNKYMTINSMQDLEEFPWHLELLDAQGALPFSRVQGVPLKKGEGSIGVLMVFNKKNEYTARDSEILSYLANEATVAIIHGELTSPRPT
jgi:CheY-like chemotaxis protein